jgi:outer membrane protein assembly factor BamE (lipoprotein component of BamABCDE complex)
MAARIGARRAGRLAALAAASVLIVGCGAQIRNHGYVPEPSLLQQVTVGVDTRESVEESVGRPTTTSLLEGEAWYYVRSRMRLVGPLPPREFERELVAISFAPDGRVSNIERFGLEDGRVVTLSRRVTETSVRDFGLVQQLLRNFGRVNVGEQLAGDR